MVYRIILILILFCSTAYAGGRFLGDQWINDADIISFVESEGYIKGINWGEIGGTLGRQSDLAEEFSTKQDAINWQLITEANLTGINWEQYGCN